MNYWLLKSEPTDYGFDDLVHDGRTVWNGITNNQALMYLREMKKGDRAIFYHTGKVKAIVGLCKIVRGPYPDPDADDAKIVAVDVAPDRPLAKPVTLAAIKSDKALADFLLVRNSRLSVMPVPLPMWEKLCSMGEIAD